MDDILQQAQKLENDYIRGWKEKGGKVLGYICVATPVELIEAGGILPYRIRALGSSETELADAYLSRFNCAFCRSCLNLGLKGDYDFLDGVVSINGCDHLRGMVENWNYARKFKFHHYLKAPHLISPESMDFFAEDIKICKRAIEEHFDLTISDDQLWEKISLQQRIREKFHTIYQMRFQEAPAFYGWEVMSLYLFLSAVPSEVGESMLERVIVERKNYQIKDYRARLLFGGSATDEVSFIKEIETLGGLVVADTFCFGARAFWNRQSQSSSSDPCRELARIYLEELFCPRMFEEFSRRKELVLKMIEQAKVDGVVLFHNKFCDLHGVDNVQLKIALEKEGIPVLTLEKEYSARADLGRFKTRIQAFLERIGK